ncbi:hypothetical protein B0H12DRAFT_1135145 [Mycena haematopus]|nr:hypothetical protein B0H12DRAFT_1135145 [Mycena haematopus]
MHVFASAVQVRLKLLKRIGFRFSVYGIHTEPCCGPGASRATPNFNLGSFLSYLPRLP